ncbi:MAG: TIGR00730 family Rossman fold protein [Bacteroidaceae bacterium]|nr:TIGR00730 family Rossman fold protein [Bacteroidaceae bacterium]
MLKYKKDMQRICVFLASREPDNTVCREAVVSVGQWIGETKRTLVYGGARKGWMELLASTVKESGGRVLGVVPQILVERGLVSDTLDVCFHSADLSDRKAIMARESDIFVALPGGIGTLDEIFTILGEVCIGISKKHLVLYNADDCWTTLLKALSELQERGLIAKETLAHLHVVEDIEGLEKICQTLI